MQSRRPLKQRSWTEQLTLYVPFLHCMKKVLYFLSHLATSVALAYFLLLAEIVFGIHICSAKEKLGKPAPSSSASCEWCHVTYMQEVFCLHWAVGAGRDGTNGPSVMLVTFPLGSQFFLVLLGTSASRLTFHSHWPSLQALKGKHKKTDIILQFIYHLALNSTV